MQYRTRALDQIQSTSIPKLSSVERKITRHTALRLYNEFHNVKFTLSLSTRATVNAFTSSRKYPRRHHRTMIRKPYPLSASESSPTGESLDLATPSELLGLASRLGRTDLAVTALRQGAKINALIPTPSPKIPNLQQTALHQAVIHNRVDVTRALLASSAAPETLDTASKTAISYLPPYRGKGKEIWHVFGADLCQKAGRGDVDGVSSLLDAGLSVNVLDAVGNTPLHWAASYGNALCVEFLLGQGAEVDIKNSDGRTPLMDAVVAGHVDVVRALLSAGADAGVKDNAGKGAVEHATSDEVLDALHANYASVGRGHENAAVGDDVSRVESGDSTEITLPIPYDTFSEHASLKSGAPEWAQLLWPRPRRLVETPGTFTLPPVMNVSAEGGCLQVGRKLVSWLRHLQFPDVHIRLVGGGHGGLGEHIMFSAAIFLRVDPCVLEHSHQAYSLTVRHYGIDVVGSDLAGLMYGCATLVNVLQLQKGADDDATILSVPACSITDWPSIMRRGLYLDASRDRIPRLETLREIVAFMSLRLKMNQLHLNLGDNFGSLRDEARDELMTHEEILELSRWCEDHFVELIPVIGKSPEYFTQLPEADMGNLGNGVGKLVGKTRSPKREVLLDEFIPLFHSKQVNIGVHSSKPSFDSGDFALLRNLAMALRCRDKRNVLIFGEKLLDCLSDESKFSRTIPEIPAQTIVIVDANNTASLSLDDQCLRLRRNGVPFYTCASSCLEGSLSGRLSICLKRIQESVVAAKSYGAAGIVLKDTSMSNLGAPLTFLYQTLIPMAGSAWNPNDGTSTSSQGLEERLSDLYDTYLFRDRPEKGTLGRVAVTLADLHRIAGDPDGNVLLKILSRAPDASPATLNTVTYSSLRRVVKKADRMESALSSYHGNAHKNDVDELRASAVFMSVAARIGALLLSTHSAASMEHGKVMDPAGIDVGVLPDGRRSDLCNSLLQAIEMSRSTWVNQYKVSGFTRTVNLTVGVALSKLSQGMPYQRYIEEREAKDWLPVDDFD